MAGYRKLRSHISPDRFMKVHTHEPVSPGPHTHKRVRSTAHESTHTAWLYFLYTLTLINLMEH